MVCMSLVPYVPLGFNFSKKGLIPRSQTGDLDQGMEHLYHCVRRLAVLISLWRCYSILLAVWMPYRFDLNWISPASGNKFVPVGLAVTTEAKDPRSAVAAVDGSQQPL